MPRTDARPPRRPDGWQAPGPRPLAPAGLQPTDGEEMVALTGDFRLFQRRGGHRWSLDDLVTAWLAGVMRRARPPSRCLDLGCGVGSVLLMVAWQFPDATLVGVEAQPESLELARRSVAWNGVTDRVTLMEGDLRDAALTGGPFDLITGTPPYFPPGGSTESADAQRRQCRFEHRGGVPDYVAAGARHLADDGTLVLCAAARDHARVDAAARAAGLVVTRRLEVIPRAGKLPLVGVHALEHGVRPSAIPTTLVVRDAAGHFTAECSALRDVMGFPPQR
ncbi:MAG: methyltransferase domain-containing protein [Myxococcales bacterium]|nr:methyltransferase domain-containing protein [Myxococcales bacterium]